MNSQNPTASNILSIAKQMLMTRGYHGFSFRDISSKAGIRAASIHYHFPTKADLGEALLAEASTDFHYELGQIEQQENTAAGRLKAFAGIFERTFGEGDRLCLVCMLAAGQDTIPGVIRTRIKSFWQEAEKWVEAQLEEGMQKGEFRLNLDSRVVAQTLLSTLEGAMLTGRSFQDTHKLGESADFLLSCLQAQE